MLLDKKGRIEYFINNQKNKCEYIGVEIEHIVTDDKYRWTSYSDRLELFKYLIEERGYSPQHVDGVLLALKKEDLDISLEPGSQLEVSIEPKKTLDEIDFAYEKFLRDIVPYLKKRNQKLLDISFQPLTEMSEIELLDKKRYRWMDEEFSKTGTMGKYMMRGSVSTQVSVDYCSEEDFIRKYQLASKLSPFISILTDNSPLCEGKIYRENALRTKIWNNTDSPRCGLLKGSLDSKFDYDFYQKELMKIRPLVMIDNDDNFYRTDKSAIEEFGDLISEKHWEYLIGMTFFDVRAKNFIEIRMMDHMGYPNHLSGVAFIKNIFYNSKTLEILENKFREFSEKDVVEFKDRIIKRGLRDSSVLDICRFIVDVVVENADVSDSKYLEIFKDIIRNKKTLKDRKVEELDINFEKALKNMEVDFELH